MGGVRKYLVVAERDADSSDTSRRREEWKCDMSADEEDLIIRLHKLLGDRWKLIAGRLPWRTAQEIEKYWKMRSHPH